MVTLFAMSPWPRKAHELSAAVGAQERRNSAQPTQCMSCCFLVFLIVALSVRVGWRNVLRDTFSTVHG